MRAGLFWIVRILGVSTGTDESRARGVVCSSMSRHSCDLRFFGLFSGCKLVIDSMHSPTAVVIDTVLNTRQKEQQQ